jgi:mannose/fructose/N-acetylgalactosamine-specific phosphotransferase system component IIB
MAFQTPTEPKNPVDSTMVEVKKMTMVVTLLNMRFKVKVGNIGLIKDSQRNHQNSNRFNNLNTVERDLERVKEFYRYGVNIR